MTDPRHSRQTVSQGIHTPIAYEYASAGARTGATGFVADDVGKFARQTDDNSVWMLIAVTPTWVRMDAVGGVPIGSVVEWTGPLEDIPSGWALCDGQSGRPDLRFIVQLFSPGDETPNILDDFNRSNVGPPPSAEWAADATLTDGLQVNTNLCRGSSANSNMDWYDHQYGPSLFVSIKIDTLPANGAAIAIFFRADTKDTDAMSGYALVWSYDDSGDDSLEIVRYDAGAVTLLDSAAGFNLAAGDSLGLLISSSSLSALYRTPTVAWDTVGLSVEDTTHRDGGYVGLLIEGITARVDDFAVTSIAKIIKT